MSPKSLDYAILRFAAAHHDNENRAGGSSPHLPAFLAGWFCAASGVPMPAELGTFRDSFRRGYREQTQSAEIAGRSPERA